MNVMASKSWILSSAATSPMEAAECAVHYRSAWDWRHPAVIFQYGQRFTRRSGISHAVWATLVHLRQTDDGLEPSAAQPIEHALGTSQLWAGRASVMQPQPFANVELREADTGRQVVFAKGSCGQIVD